MIKLTAADALVTTPVSASTLDKELAADLADRLGSVFYTRGKNTISDLARSCRVKAAVVVSSEEIHLVHYQATGHYIVETLLLGSKCNHDITDK